MKFRNLASVAESRMRKPTIDRTPSIIGNMARKPANASAAA